MKATITLTRQNHEYLKHQDGTMSDFINDVLQAHRSLGPMLDRMKKQADRLDQIGIKAIYADSPPFQKRTIQMITYPEFQWARAALLQLTSVTSVKQSASEAGILVKDAIRFQTPIYQKYLTIGELVAAFPEIAAHPDLPDVAP